MSLRKINAKPAPEGYKWVCCRFRRKRNSDEVLDAQEYGYEAWCFLVKM
ncbi:MAG: hypothetical protein R3271_04095 [Methylophaga sp.]|nr:hypothetical protein [Methylophaga sp.]MDX1749486.1 hypothetical protein [Methylophaga sp.]